jgi:nicotinamide-nucleotide amidase
MGMDFLDLTPQLVQLGEQLRQRQWRLACAESCTGGLLAAACTSVAGSSDWFERGFVTYSNAAKCESLGVDPDLISAHGAVSQAVALEMVRGVLRHAAAQVAVGITGIAGPGGAVPGKPVGTVWLAWGTAQATHSELLKLGGDRSAVREAAVRHAVHRLLHASATVGMGTGMGAGPADSGSAPRTLA